MNLPALGVILELSFVNKLRRVRTVSSTHMADLNSPAFCRSQTMKYLGRNKRKPHEIQECPATPAAMPR